MINAEEKKDSRRPSRFARFLPFGERGSAHLRSLAHIALLKSSLALIRYVLFITHYCGDRFSAADYCFSRRVMG